jgi:hypothetical protein
MAALTSMRTGSYTKARDSPKSLTPESKAMWHESGPLRFEHTGFFLTHDGVGLQLTFTHWKNSIRADLARRDHIRVLTFLPLKSRSFYLDLSSLLFALAYHRGLFAQELRNIFSTRTSERPTFIPTHAHMHTQSVFVSDMTDPTSPMGSKRWTDLLQQLFIDSGLVGRYPPYAFRRGTGSMFKMKRGMLAAEEVAGHDQHGTTIRHYNRQPLFGLDIAGVLTGTTTTYDQVETYLQFAPARMWRWSSTGNEPTLGAAIHESVELTCPSRAFAFCDTPGAAHLLHRILQENGFTSITASYVPH